MTLQILLKEARSADNFLYFLYINRARQEAFRGGTEGSRRLFPYGKFAKFAKEAANHEALIKKPSKFMRDESEMSVLEPKMSVFESEMSVFESEMSVFESEMSVLEPKMSVFDSEMSVLDSEMYVPDSEMIVPESSTDIFICRLMVYSSIAYGLLQDGVVCSGLPVEPARRALRRSAPCAAFLMSAKRAE